MRLRRFAYKPPACADLAPALGLAPASIRAAAYHEAVEGARWVSVVVEAVASDVQAGRFSADNLRATLLVVHELLARGEGVRFGPGVGVVNDAAQRRITEALLREMPTIGSSHEPRRSFPNPNMLPLVRGVAERDPRFVVTLRRPLTIERVA